MIRLGLAGYPLEHSLSPVLHAAAFRATGLQGKYSLYPVEPGDVAALGHLVDRVRAGELIGLNVTIPHKQAVLRFLDDLTPAARTVGAVNTIYLEGSKVLGDNTDAPGFLTDLRQLLRHSPRSSIVMGAGGAARAVVPHGTRHKTQDSGPGTSIRPRAQASPPARDYSSASANQNPPGDRLAWRINTPATANPVPARTRYP